MKIQVLKIIRENVVEFSTAIGTGVGTFNTNKVNIGDEYSVEFDIDKELKIGSNARKTLDKNYFIRKFNNKNEIQGSVDGVDEDGMIYLRLSDSCIIMIESAEDKINSDSFLLLTVDVEDLKITEI